MRISLRGWVFLFFGGMALLSGGAGWLFLTKLSMNGGYASGGLLLAYLAGVVLLAGLLASILSAMLYRSHRSFIESVQKLTQNDLSRLSSANGALSEGNIAIHVEPQSAPLNESLYPGSEDLVRAYNEMIQQIHQIYRKFNDVTDEPCRRMVYVGADSYREGRVCGELMGQLLGGQGKIAIVTGLQGQGLEIRKSGFAAMLNEKFPGIEIVAVFDCQGQANSMYPKVTEILKQIPDLNGLYVPEGGTPHLAARAIQDAGKAGKVKMVCHDLVDEAMQAMQRGVVSATVSQDPFAQGHDPVIYLYNYLVCGQLPPRQKMITPMDRITQENYREFWDPEHGAIENGATQERRARPVNKLPDRRLRILVLGREDVDFFTPVKQGALAAGEELKSRNTLVEWVEPETARQSRMYAASDYGPEIEAAIAGKYDAVVVPVYDKALVSYINRAVAAGIPVATYNSEPSSLRGLMNHLITQAQQLRDISVDLAQSAAVSGGRANQINASIGEMTQALYEEVQSAEEAIENAQQMAQAITNISEGAQEQTNAVSSVTVAVDHIASAVNTTNATAQVSEQNAAQAVQIAKQGAETIQQTLSQIQEISKAVSASVVQIHELNKISKQINSIVNTVSDFAEQTNMLALNAAIEAARAGEAGGGFAVVASEIRSLAEMSKRSTKEIASLIRDVQQNSNKIVKTVDDAMNQAQAGGSLATQAGQALSELLHSAETMKEQTEKVVQANTSVVEALDQLTNANQRVSAVVEENASATRQVTENIKHTVELVNHITGISKANSHSIEGIHTSTDDVAERAQGLKDSIELLVTMAEEMQGSVAAFKIGEEG